jgi:GH25 family lysozyme M1 (1,4-beta-N-acetylmuramidase)
MTNGNMTNDNEARGGARQRAGSKRLRAVRASGATLAAVALLSGPVAGAALAAPASGPVAGAATATSALQREASEAAGRLAINLRAPHPGRFEAATHPLRDGLTAGRPAVASRDDRAAALPSGVLGIDVSGYQGDVDWSAAAVAGVQFAYVKATEGTYYFDSTYFPEQYDGSYDAGLVRGAYHFAIPSNSTGAAQADYFVAHGGGWSADGHTLPGMLDLESNPYGAMCYGLSRSQLVGWLASFDGEYQRLTGRMPVLYTNAYWWDTCVGASSVADQDPLAIANYGVSYPSLPSGGWPFYTVWQYTDHNALGVDGDVFNGSRQQLLTLVIGRPPAAELASGRGLLPGQELVSADGRYELIMQADGNLVEYVVGGPAVWQSRTSGHPGAFTVMQSDGNLVLYSAEDQPLFATGTAGRGPSYAVVQDDGNVVVYASSGGATWASGMA